MSGTTEKLNTRMKKGLQSAVLFSSKSFGSYRGKHIRILDSRGMSGKGGVQFSVLTVVIGQTQIKMPQQGQGKIERAAAGSMSYVAVGLYSYVA